MSREGPYAGSHDSGVDRLGNQGSPRVDTFATTRWTLVLTAGSRKSPEADAALADLCRTYWFPLYAYVRRKGFSREDAEDLVQGFFARLLQRGDLQGLRSERGRFRAFLLACLKHFLADQHDRSHAAKRGGGRLHLPIDGAAAASRFESLPSPLPGPEQAFDREWAVALLSSVVERLRAEWAANGPDGRQRHFEELKVFLTAGKGVRSYAAAAFAIGIDEGTARVTVHRLRKRYRQLLREEIAQTLANPAQIEEEMRALFAAFET